MKRLVFLQSPGMVAIDSKLTSVKEHFGKYIYQWHGNCILLRIGWIYKSKLCLILLFASKSTEHYEIVKRRRSSAREKKDYKPIIWENILYLNLRFYKYKNRKSDAIGYYLGYNHGVPTTKEEYR